MPLRKASFLLTKASFHRHFTGVSQTFHRHFTDILSDVLSARENAISPSRRKSNMICSVFFVLSKRTSYTPKNPSLLVRDLFSVEKKKRHFGRENIFVAEKAISTKQNAISSVTKHHIRRENAMKRHHISGAKDHFLHENANLSMKKRHIRHEETLFPFIIHHFFAFTHYICHFGRENADSSMIKRRICRGKTLYLFLQESAISACCP